MGRASERGILAAKPGNRDGSGFQKWFSVSRAAFLRVVSDVDLGTSKQISFRSVIELPKTLVEKHVLHSFTFWHERILSRGAREKLKALTAAKNVDLWFPP